MKRILYYTWIGMWVIIGTPIVLAIIAGAWIHDKYHKLTCKMCKK
jgi:hypothetical protein